MKTRDIITLSRKRGCLSTGHFGKSFLKEENLQQQTNKKSENKQNLKKSFIAYIIYSFHLRVSSLGHTLLRKESIIVDLLHIINICIKKTNYNKFKSIHV